MLLVIPSDMVNQMPIPSLMGCIASDYADSRSRKYGHANRHLLLQVFFTLLSILCNSQTYGYWRPSFATEPLSFSQDASFSAI